MTDPHIIQSITDIDPGSIPESDCEILPYVETPRNPSKTGNKPKQLKAVEVYGYECGRGMRKRIVFPDDVFKLAALGHTDREIAIWFDMDEQTLRYNFKAILEKGRIDLKKLLRQAMLNNAIKNNNAAVQIFLSKNLLGYSDTPQSADKGVLPFNDDEPETIDTDNDDNTI